MRQVRSILAGAVVILVSISVAYGHGDSYGRMSGALTTADACGMGRGFLGGFIGLGDHATSIFGTYTYGFSKYTEGRLKFGFSDPEDTYHNDYNPGVLIGADLKYEFMDHYDPAGKAPFDMAAGGSMEFVKVGDGSVFQLGGNLIGSIPYRFRSGHRIVPYALVNFRLERFSDGNTHSDFEAGLNLGAKFEFSNELYLYGEFQLDGNDAFFTGIEIRVF